MISAKKWMLFAIFIFVTFASDKNTNPNEQKYTALNHALLKGDEKKASFLLNDFDKKDKEKFIEYSMQGDEYKRTNLHHASQNGQKDIVRLLLDLFVGEEKNEKLIQYIIKEDKYKFTALHLASNNGWEDIANLLLSAFSEEEDKEKLIEYVIKENAEQQTALELALKKGDEKIVQLLWNVLEKEKKIEFLMKEDKYKYTVLHDTSYRGHTAIVKILLNTFTEEENEKMLNYAMKKNKDGQIALELALQKGNEANEIVQLLLNLSGKDESKRLIEHVMKEATLQKAVQKGDEKMVKFVLNVFSEKENDKLIEYLMKADEQKNTVLHYALKEGNEKFVKLLINQFGKKKNEKLMEYLMRTSHCIDSANIKRLLSRELVNAKNQKFLCKLQSIAQMFKNQTTDRRKKSPLWNVFRKKGVKETILSFIITDYTDYYADYNYSEIDIFEDGTSMDLHDETILKKYQDVSLQFEGRNYTWGFHIEWNYNWSNYEVIKMAASGQARTLGVETGWTIKSVNGDIKRSNRKAIMDAFNRAETVCTIVFEK